MSYITLLDYELIFLLFNFTKPVLSKKKKISIIYERSFFMNFTWFFDILNKDWYQDLFYRGGKKYFYYPCQFSASALRGNPIFYGGIGPYAGDASVKKRDAGMWRMSATKLMVNLVVKRLTMLYSLRYYNHEIE